MDLQLWWTFCIGTFIICATPGPNMLQVMSTSMRHGFKAAFLAMAGCFIPVFIFICISLAGAGAMLKTFPLMFDILRYAGAAYLIYLGVMAWREPAEQKEGEVFFSSSPRKIFTHSFLVGISNPKALLFAAAYFPQFLNPDSPQALQYAILLATFSVLEIGCYMAYALSGSKLSVTLQKASVKRIFDRLTGSIFAFFGVMLIAKAH